VQDTSKCRYLYLLHVPIDRECLSRETCIPNRYDDLITLTNYFLESGWPSSPGGSTIRSTPNVANGQQCTTAGDSDQRIGAQNILNVFRQNKKPINLFSGYKEAWKSSGNDFSIEEYWGVCSGSPPYACPNAPK
jgi:hypothetical protein